jgi:hypothetical protein
VLEFDSDPEGTAISAERLTNAGNGNAILSSNGSLSYTPNPGFVGIDSFTYYITDQGFPGIGGGDSSAAATVTIIVQSNVLAVDEIADQATEEDTPWNVPFTVAGGTVPLESLTVTATSSNTTLVPNANLVITSGVAGNRELLITPAANQHGLVMITVTVTDGVGTASDTFPFTINPVNDAPTIQDIPTKSGQEDITKNISFSVSDIDTPLANLTLSGSSSNQTIIPNANISFSGSSATRTITIVPAPNQNGSVVLTVQVSDGESSASDTFNYVVSAVNDAPTISNIIDQSINENTPLGPLPFTIGDLEKAANKLTVSAVSSNTTLIPNTNLVLGGTSANRTIAVTPAANQSGTATITVTVSDGSLTASDTFIVTVQNLPGTPTITGLINTSTNEDTLITVNFTVDDSETPVGDLTVSAVSSNGVLVSNAALVPGGSGANRTLTITPTANLNGTTTIMVSVSDGTATGVASFVLTINPVNDAPTISDIPTKSSQEDITKNIPFTINDVDTPLNSLVLTGTSNNQTIIPNANISFTGTGTSRNIVIVPVLNQNGALDITITVSDGSLSASDTFRFVVSAVNDRPTISDIPDQTTPQNTAVGPINFTIGDVEKAANLLTVTAVSSDQTVVPNASIVLGGSGANRTITITPAAGQTGTTTITVTVSDGSLTQTDTLVVTVN